MERKDDWRTKPKKGSRGASGMSNEMEYGNELELFAEKKTILRGRIKSLQSKVVDMKMNLDKPSLCQRFLKKVFGMCMRRKIHMQKSWTLHYL